MSPTQLSYDDVARCHVVSTGLDRVRRLPTPSWAMNDSMLRKLLVVCIQRRCGKHRPVITDDIAEQKAILERCRKIETDAIIPRLIACLGRHCHRYVATEDKNTKAELEPRISALDTRLQVLQAGPGFLIRLVYCYYRQHLTCVETGEALHVQANLGKL